MKEFSCGDVVPGCSAHFRGTESQIMRAVEDHARADHGLAEIPAPLIVQVRQALRDAAA